MLMDIHIGSSIQATENKRIPNIFLFFAKILMNRGIIKRSLICRVSYKLFADNPSQDIRLLNIAIPNWLLL